jgi:hypothetical protein
MSDVIVTCRCGQKNRVPPAEKRGSAQVQCAKCHRQFSAADILDAKQRALGTKPGENDIFKNFRDIFDPFGGGL